MPTRYFRTHIGSPEVADVRSEGYQTVCELSDGKRDKSKRSVATTVIVEKYSKCSQALCSDPEAFCADTNAGLQRGHCPE